MADTTGTPPDADGKPIREDSAPDLDLVMERLASEFYQKPDILREVAQRILEKKELELG